jgi:plastocyanin
LTIAFALSFCLAANACTSSYQAPGSSGPMAPTSTTPPNLTIDVAEINGPYSFYPNPAAVQGGQTVIWRNSDSITHHVVFDDGSIDAGTLAPGTVSQPIRIGAGTHGYHCAIHPEMVGTVSIASSTSDGH